MTARPSPPTPPSLTAKDGSTVAFDPTGKPTVTPAPPKAKKPRGAKPNRVKAGTSKSAAAVRKTAFIAAYLANGRNATQAAITAGYSEKGARVRGSQLLADRNVSTAITERTEAIEKITGLDQERTLREVARVAYSDIRKVFRHDGTMVPIAEMDDDTAAIVGSVETLEEFSGTGEDREVSGYTKKIKLWDKNAALEKAMKFHGLYEKDNSQTASNITVEVVVVAAPGVPR